MPNILIIYKLQRKSASEFCYTPYYSNVTSTGFQFMDFFWGETLHSGKVFPDIEGQEADKIRKPDPWSVILSERSRLKEEIVKKKQLIKQKRQIIRRPEGGALMPCFQSRAQLADLFFLANNLANEKSWVVYYSSPNFRSPSVKGIFFPCCVKTYMLLAMVADPNCNSFFIFFFLLEKWLTVYLF